MEQYQVRLSVFQGPLDLLLHLIEKQELDITIVSLAQVTDQYLSHLHIVEQIQPDDLADFMAVAARLLLLKSRALLPRPPKIIEEEQDGSDDLVRQLEEYRRFKQAARFLARRSEQNVHMHLRAMPVSKLTRNCKPRLDLAGTTLENLVGALQALLQETQPDPGSPPVAPHTVTIADQIARIKTLIQSTRTLTFANLLRDARSNIEIIVTLLAILELIRARHVTVHQEQLFGEITITGADHDDA